jgi:hypothetical protein
MTNYLEIWGIKAKELLLNKKIIQVRYLSKDECKDLGWYESVIAFQTNDGIWFYPSRDDEGNGGGALFTSNDAIPTLPVIGCHHG